MLILPDNAPDPLFAESHERVLNLAVFGSGSGTNLRALLEAQHDNDNSPFRVCLVVTNRECPCCDIAADYSVPCIVNHFRSFKGKYQSVIANPHELRLAYDQRTVDLIRAFEKRSQCTIDFIFLAGYMMMVYSPILTAFQNRILNIHPADLTRLDREGKRLYVGKDAIQMALEAGERRTRSSVILVNAEMDGGKVIVSGPWIDYEGPYPPNEQSISVHCERQKALSDWPASIAAIYLIAEGGIRMSHDNKLLYLGTELGVEGYELHQTEGKLCVVS